MNKQVKLALAAAAAMLAMTTASYAQKADPAKGSGYVIGAETNIVKSGTGLCWRTGFFTPAMAVAGCDDDLLPKPAPAPAPQVAPPPPPPPAPKPAPAPAPMAQDRFQPSVVWQQQAVQGQPLEFVLRWFFLLPAFTQGAQSPAGSGVQGLQHRQFGKRPEEGRDAHQHQGFGDRLDFDLAPATWRGSMTTSGSCSARLCAPRA